MIVEGIVHPEFAENVPSAHPKYTVDEFVSSSEQIWRNLASCSIGEHDSIILCCFERKGNYLMGKYLDGFVSYTAFHFTRH